MNKTAWLMYWITEVLSSWWTKRHDSCVESLKFYRVDEQNVMTHVLNRWSFIELISKTAWLMYWIAEVLSSWWTKRHDSCVESLKFYRVDEQNGMTHVLNRWSFIELINKTAWLMCWIAEVLSSWWTKRHDSCVESLKFYRVDKQNGMYSCVESLKLFVLLWLIKMSTITILK
jgi:virulence-associated protein VapD